MDAMQLIQMMASNIRNLDVVIKEVPVKFKKQGTVKQCFNNAFSDILASDIDGKKYVLGYLIFESGGSSLPIEHAWVKQGSQYYDVTLPEEKVDSMKYVSVVELTFNEVSAYVNEHQHAPDLYAYGRFMRNK